MEKEEIRLLTGNQAEAEAQRQIKSRFFLTTYGRRPGSAAETLSRYASNRLFEGEIIFFSSAEKLLAFAIGAALAGASVSLNLTSEEIFSVFPLLRLVALNRLPLVMNVLASCEEEVSLIGRECSWLQVSAGCPQDVYLANLLVTVLTRNEEIRLPVMISRDEYFGSEFYEETLLLSNDHATRFLGKSLGEEWRDWWLAGEKGKWERSFARSLTKYRQYNQALKTFTGRVLEPVSYFGHPHPKALLVTLGAKSGEARAFLEKAGKDSSLGLLVINLYRPLPVNDLKEAIARCQRIGVWGGTPLFDDLKKVVEVLVPKPPLKLFCGREPQVFYEELLKNEA